MDIVKAAASFGQYNVESMDWETEGAADSPARKFIKRAIHIRSDEVNGARVLDVGCGTGWFLAECLKKGALAAEGIEPSRLAEISASLVPNATIYQETFAGFEASEGKFDFISFIMSTENMPDLAVVLAKTKKLLRDTGRVLILTGDFDRFQKENHGNKVTKQVILPNKEIAVRIERPNGYGTTHDILRTVEFWVETINTAGMTVLEQKTVLIDREFAEDDPKRKPHIGEPIFQLFRLIHIGGNYK